MIVSDLPSPVEASNEMTNSYRGLVQPFPPPIKSTTRTAACKLTA